MSIFLRREYGASRLTAPQIIRDWRLFLAFGFGSGLSRYMPGTLGTVSAVPLYLLLSQTGFWVYTGFVVITMLAGILICDYAAERLAVHDFNGIVWDEIVGFLITMWLIPYSVESLFAGFVLFRLFDIVKPWPIRWADKEVTGGIGIMLDDVLAGLFSALLLMAIF